VISFRVSARKLLQTAHVFTLALLLFFVSNAERLVDPQLHADATGKFYFTCIYLKYIIIAEHWLSAESFFLRILLCAYSKFLKNFLHEYATRERSLHCSLEKFMIARLEKSESSADYESALHVFDIRDERSLAISQSDRINWSTDGWQS